MAANNQPWFTDEVAEFLARLPSREELLRIAHLHVYISGMARYLPRRKLVR